MEQVSVFSQVIALRISKPGLSIFISKILEIKISNTSWIHPTELLYPVEISSIIEKNPVRTVFGLKSSEGIVIVSAGDPVALTCALNLFINKQSAIGET